MVFLHINMVAGWQWMSPWRFTEKKTPFSDLSGQSCTFKSVLPPMEFLVRWLVQYKACLYDICTSLVFYLLLSFLPLWTRIRGSPLTFMFPSDERCPSQKQQSLQSWRRPAPSKREVTELRALTFTIRGSDLPPLEKGFWSGKKAVKRLWVVWAEHGRSCCSL